MSIEKFNPSIRGETVPYLQVNRNVVQSIRDPEVLAVWVYLLSLPTDWEVIKNHLQSHFKIGERKLKSIFSSLRQHKLIDYIQHRNSDGKMGKHEIVVLNGSIFTELFTENTAGAETARAVNRTSGNADLHIKQNTYKKENIKSFCEKPEKAESKKPDWKDANQKKHSWADGNKVAPVADVTKQSTSYDPDKHNSTAKFDPNSPGYQAFLDANPRIKRAREKREASLKTTELSTGTAVSAEVPSREHPSETRSEHALDGQSYLAPELRNGYRVMAPSSARSYLEKTGLACEDHSPSP